jgi:hypothetical protein
LVGIGAVLTEVLAALCGPMDVAITVWFIYALKIGSFVDRKIEWEIMLIKILLYLQIRMY